MIYEMMHDTPQNVEKGNSNINTYLKTSIWTTVNKQKTQDKYRDKRNVVWCVLVQFSKH